ncbi:MAG: hypothetical protein E6H10_06905 [Bacteroidetes bacterium]|nr:MAG: hypothetical protein E6H10_06905 [Bacteroidota bacterium]
MKQYLVILLMLFALQGRPQGSTDINTNNLAGEVSKLKEQIKSLQENEAQSEKVKYMRNYQLVLYGIDIIKEIKQGTVEISNARSQNILYKKIIDINNPASDALGFQLMDVIDKTLEDNINALPLVDGEKKRLKGQVSGLVDGLKKTFPPLQIISSVVGMISSFTTFRTRMEKLDKRTDSLVVEASYPITKEIISKINLQLAPYIDFYTQLNKINNTYENALYNHVIEYKDFMEEVDNLQTTLGGSLDMNESTGEQINNLFDLANSSRQDFDYKKTNENDKIRAIAGSCLSVFDLVDRYKKFTSDFIAIQDGFYHDYISLLDDKAKKLPIKDDERITKLVADLSNIKNGNPTENVKGFDESYKTKLKSITTKVVALNRTRF